MMKASFVVAVPLALALGVVATTASIASAQTDPHVGTWKLNLAKSKFSPGPPPQSQTLTYEADGQGLTVLLQGVDGAGKPINADKTKLHIIMDGKDHPSPNPDYDTTAWTPIGANGYKSTRKKAGKLVQALTNTVAKDGKTMTTTTKGTNSKGEAVNNMTVYDKQ